MTEIEYKIDLVKQMLKSGETTTTESAYQEKHKTETLECLRHFLLEPTRENWEQIGRKLSEGEEQIILNS